MTCPVLDAVEELAAAGPHALAVAEEWCRARLWLTVGVEGLDTASRLPGPAQAGFAALRADLDRVLSPARPALEFAARAAWLGAVPLAEAGVPDRLVEHMAQAAQVFAEALILGGAAATAERATVLAALLPDWAGTVDDLVVAAGGVLAGPGAGPGR